MRLLLFVVKGPKSFEDLKNDDAGKSLGNTFVDAALARGLMNDDTLWDATARDALDEKRSLNERIRWFAIFLANVNPKKPVELLNTHFRLLTTWPGLSEEQKMNRLLTRIEYTLRAQGIRTNDSMFQINTVFIYMYISLKNGVFSVQKTACEVVGLPAPKNFKMTLDDEFECIYARDDFLAKHVADEDGDQSGIGQNYDNLFNRFYGLCTESEQRPFVDQILQAATEDPSASQTHRLHFLTGEGGTGKTFVYNVCYILFYLFIC